MVLDINWKWFLLKKTQATQTAYGENIIASIAINGTESSDINWDISLVLHIKFFLQVRAVLFCKSKIIISQRWWSNIVATWPITLGMGFGSFTLLTLQ